MNRYITIFIASVMVCLTNLLCYYPAYAQKQGQVLIDSLLKMYPLAAADTNKVKLLNDLATNYYNINPDEGIKYGKQAQELARSLHWDRGEAWAYNKTGINYWARSDYGEALVNQFKALKIMEALGDMSAVAVIKGNIGIVYGDENEYDKAIDYEQQALATFEALGDKKGVAKNLGNMGAIYTSLENYPKALDCYFKALKIDEEIGDKKGMAINNANIGDSYTFQGKNDKALEHELNALKIFRELGAKDGIAMSERNMGQLYMQEKYYDKALEYYNNALSTFEEIGDKNKIALTLSNIGLTYSNLNYYSKGLLYYLQALRISKEIGDDYGVVQNLGNIGFTYLSVAKDTTGAIKSDSLIDNNRSVDLRRAIDYLNQSIDLGKKINFSEAYSFCKDLSEAYQLAGDHKKALECYLQYTTMNDSINNAKTKLSIANLETVRDLELKDKELKISLLKKNNERLMFIAGIAILLLVIGVFVIVLYKRINRLSREKMKNLEKIEAQTAVLKDITFDQAHRIRAPLASVLGLVHLFNYDDLTDPVNKEVMNNLAEATDNLDNIVKEVIYKANKVS